MSDPATRTMRRVEVHFALEDEALVVDVDETDTDAVDHLLMVLDAEDVHEAEGLLQEKALSASRKTRR
jgi:hypothetical protein